MQAYKHPEYPNEKEKLSQICVKIDNEIKKHEKEVNFYEEKSEGVRKTSSGGFVTEFEMASHMYEIHSKNLLEYKTAYNKPYFGRIDFKKMGNEKTEVLYVGKTSLINKEDKKMLIVDWRAPISSIYYSGELGEAYYRSPDGIVFGDLLLKRQYEIEKRKLINIFDKGLTPMDEFLQNALWQKKDNRLKDIVMTIQSEQNDIIRAEKNKVIIVQGAAGSGKTTIVLHRIAYLMYTYKDSLKAQNILTIVPNKLFLKYISDVLPDLGIKEITQSTFEDLGLKILGRKIKLVEREEKIVNLIDRNTQNSKYRNDIINASLFKGSLVLKTIIDDYIKNIEKTIIPEDIGIDIEGYEIFSSEEISELFSVDYSYLPLIKRMNRVKKHVKGTYKERIYIIKFKLLKELNKGNEFDENKDKIKRIEDNIVDTIDQYFKKLLKIDIYNVYKNIVTNVNNLSKYIKEDSIYGDPNDISEYSQSVFNDKMYELDDLAPLIYLKMKLSGLNDKFKFSHIVIDEAQDYNSFQMYILKELNDVNSFTIVGDLSQGIYSYSGVQDWNDFIFDVFGKNNTEFLKIKKCYRSTKEIMEFANKIISNSKNENLVLAEPVLRSGDIPEVIECKDEKEMIFNIINDIKDYKDKGFKSIAIICKNGKESLETYNKIKSGAVEDVQLISNKDEEYNGGVVVIPIYMAKGLEFDGVIINNCSKEEYIKDELDIKLLYVAATRALHKLTLYYYGDKSELLSFSS